MLGPKNLKSFNNQLKDSKNTRKMKKASLIYKEVVI